MGRLGKEDLLINDFGKKLEKFELVLGREIDIRRDREMRGLWRDEDILRMRNAELQEAIPQVEILSGNAEVLSEFLARERQRDSDGHFRYLLTSGLAVEVITGVSRYHHDIDLVLFDYKNGWWIRYPTDNVVAGKYWADMVFDPAYLEQTAWTAEFQASGRIREVSTVHPGIILVQKLSNAWGRPPRRRDVDDVRELIGYWQESQNSDPSWDPVMRMAIAALPYAEQARTKGRLSQALKLSGV